MHSTWVGECHSVPYEEGSRGEGGVRGGHIHQPLALRGAFKNYSDKHSIEVVAEDLDSANGAAAGVLKGCVESVATDLVGVIIDGVVRGGVSRDDDQGGNP